MALIQFSGSGSKDSGDANESRDSGGGVAVNSSRSGSDSGSVTGINRSESLERMIGQQR